ncbi:MAG: hypothetical protein RL324_713 [Verrucomicrobiota bacterium]|jgi:hypothetical protein
MHILERTLITKSGYDNGWEVVAEDTSARVVLASALHRARVIIAGEKEPGADWNVRFDQASLTREVGRTVGIPMTGTDHYVARGDHELGGLLREAARLARALPDAPERRYAQAVAKALATDAIVQTEVKRMVTQRIGQDVFRDSLMDYWGGACAVTGIAIPELLRASHTKPWTDCSSDAERLNVFNGFLLVAHLDALYDRHLMTFDESGEARFAAQIDGSTRVKLGLSSALHLRWVCSEHQEFLGQHREAFRRANPNISV